ncbi:MULTISPECIES: DUF983 domain-containing protein [unclassified Sphingomonas]|uniref:DUF983 domain-containing protein n=1 Tax=unclassified Sphingomonas TaxID=196159 RepID=UPI0006F2190B|nr:MULTISPECIES: DUF983 domain-containing protein [unclassified Sphingomonas]KQX17776.1 hypothetical protein ASD17_18860 [Sphingomonas sp. Root1294]KQY70702.1 hypothetical protein ASD39_22760 [Sphingomonas sp. Root50]KRB91804.1 hypothetical protein ASE22_07550 [Sphingomonas sp. Root720]
MPEPSTPPPPAPVEAALRGLCPRCGTPGLFASFLRFADRCSGCGLDYRSFNVGDGAAAFLILIVGGVVSLLAILVELKWSPPLVVHLLLWLPLTILLTVLLLRLAKGLLLVLEYRNAAREGRIARPD